MSEITEIDVNAVARKLADFMQENWDCGDPVFVEGAWVAIQMVASPRLAADVINYCST